MYHALFPNKPIIVLKPGETLDNVSASNIVYDFGGFLDNRVADIAKQVSVCIVPIFYRSNADLTATAKTIIALQQFTQHIAIVINSTEKIYQEELTASLKQEFPNIPTFVLNFSRYVPRLANEGKTLHDMYHSNGLNKYLLRDVWHQRNKLFEYITSLNNQ